MDKIKAKLACWKGFLLSIMGRVQLVNSVLSNMFVHSFHVYKWPSSLLNQLTVMLRNFIWSGDISNKKICTVSWNTACKPREDGGLAIKDPSCVNEASLLHLCWKMLISDEKWAVMCRARFLGKNLHVSYNLSSSIWHGLKHHISTVFHPQGLSFYGG